MDALDRLQIAYEVVPGISAFQAAAATLKVELTAPDVAQTIILTRTPGRTPMPPSEDLSRLAQSRATLCIFLSTDRIAELTGMLAGHYGPDCPAALVFMPRGPTSGHSRHAGRHRRAGPRGRNHPHGHLPGGICVWPGPRRVVSKLYDKTFAPRIIARVRYSTPDRGDRRENCMLWESVPAAGSIAPSGRSRRSPRAETIVGYQPYLESIADLTAGKELVASGMTHEVVRCRQALKGAAAGEVVALISSGDAGIYGMAGLALELAEAEHLCVPIEIVPGVTAASAAAAALGAPLMLDFAVISLSDLLVSWETIRPRLEAVAAADLWWPCTIPAAEARQPIASDRRNLPGRPLRPTPVGIVTAAGQDEQSLAVTDLDHLLEQDADMQTVVIIGNTSTRLIDGCLVTARGYLQCGEN